MAYKKKEELIEDLKIKDSKIDELSATIDAQNKKMAELLSQFEKLKEDIQKPTTKTTEYYVEKPIDPNRLVPVMNMVQCPCVYKNGDAELTFDSFGEKAYITFKDLKKIKNKYNKYFKELEIRILDREIAESNFIGLKKVYQEKDISIEDFEEMCKWKGDKIVEKLATLSKPIRISFISYFIFEAAKGNEACNDPAKHMYLDKYFNLTPGRKIYNLIQLNQEVNKKLDN